MQVDLRDDPPANVGDGDVTIDCWLRPSSTGNDLHDAITPGNNGDGVNSHIFWDRDILNRLNGFGLGLSGGRLTGWRDRSGSAPTVISFIGTTDIRDDQAHHIRVCYTLSNGAIEGWVDGTREINVTGPVGGDLSYVFDEAEATNDRYYVIGTEKHQFEGFGYVGEAAEVALFNSVLSTGSSITVPTAPWATDTANLVDCRRFNEGSGTVIGDTQGGPNGLLVVDGAEGPTWNEWNPYV